MSLYQAHKQKNNHSYSKYPSHKSMATKKHSAKHHFRRICGQYIVGGNTKSPMKHQPFLHFNHLVFPGSKFDSSFQLSNWYLKSKWSNPWWSCSTTVGGKKWKSKVYINVFFNSESVSYVPSFLIKSLPRYGGFLKWWYPTTMGFPTKNDHFGSPFWGRHYFWKHPSGDPRVWKCFFGCVRRPEWWRETLSSPHRPCHQIAQGALGI